MSHLLARTMLLGSDPANAAQVTLKFSDEPRTIVIVPRPDAFDGKRVLVLDFLEPGVADLDYSYATRLARLRKLLNEIAVADATGDRVAMKKAMRAAQRETE